MIKSLDDAIKRGMAIRCEKRFFAIGNDGVWYAIPSEWRLMYGVNWRNMPKRKQINNTEKRGKR